MTASIITEIKDHIALITIDRPEERNVLNRECWLALRDTVLALNDNDEVRVIVLTGAGNKAFSAGADIHALLQRTMKQTLENENGGCAKVIENSAKPTIAAINGYALGGGCEVALACDIRIASTNAKLGQTEINVGTMPGAGGTQRLARLAGLSQAMEMVLAGTIIDAQRALSIGLVNYVVEPEQLLPKAMELAAAIAAKPPLVVRLAKLALLGGSQTDLSAGLLIERLCQTMVYDTKDHTEGLKAFLEKRPPEYCGD